MLQKKVWISLLGMVLCVGPASAVDFSSHGYYRTRFEYSHDLDTQRTNHGIVSAPDNDDNDRFGTIAFGQQRLRVNPHLKLNDHLSIHGQMDFLDNLLFGQSDVSPLTISNPVVGTMALPQANGPFGVIGSQGGDAQGSGGGNFNVRRVYLDILTAAGKFRIGRQPTHWGLGIFLNDGDEMEGDFGDTFDRFLWIAALDMMWDTKLNFGFAYDYGFEATVDPSVTGIDNGTLSNFNDARQFGFFTLLQHSGWEFGTLLGLRWRDGNDGAFTTNAVYIDTTDIDGDGNVIEGVTQPAGLDGDTVLYNIDLYGHLEAFEDYTLGFEAVYIGGKIASGIAIDAVVLDDASQAGITSVLPNPVELPLTGEQNDVSVIMGALEATGKWDFGGEGKVMAGFAGGDSAPLSKRITQLGFRPDYDIALILFDMPVGTSPAIQIGNVIELGHKPVTPNYINNAIYVAAEYMHNFDITSGVPWASDFKVGGRAITAWAPSRNLDIDFAQITGVATLPRVVNTSDWYGVEVDFSVESTFFEYLHWKSTVGALLPGGVFDIKNDELARATGGIIQPIAFDGAEPVIAAKTTLFVEF